MEIKRQRQRTIVDIAVTLTTVLDSSEARIIDLSEQGAQIVGVSLAQGAKFQIEYMGQTVYAQCMWSEIDRIGVRFPFDLTDGPLYDALMMGTPSNGMAAHTHMNSEGFMAPAPNLAAIPARRFGAASFGRRNSA